ncbi:MAG: polyribonucleotide nucleotidyltransferase [Pigeon pea little leaf phytoplasma]|uniref:Polyribonucleotide nucleotidyltransferase n=1 Tax=Candidatus Phytoplasma fabacearum TaxID=2982628 RepID=A0ABU8ZTY8_9MOLU|nr:polyribonucleotide nucleotidyltransferase ['Bituminaria bituminosa' little leaf phytoplasma]MDV3148912.1 polyribonucleotide nucleotidyltransferase [Pigeon pea little leaf phytoplasma]MDO7983806.1 polyribonucleotide nucleotidyltransferase ['Bituminaria bituminosa' little leaf phytoplasma]MDO8024129.1 polyribonucleotide nucleotidyltransferase ['Bituminaria bituminosa' little leaf phytoplasma]MDO8030832.1 polyribonucleotide nucleotidyltransferase ['Bituminaria bituminosa' little leaf phytoplasm
MTLKVFETTFENNLLIVEINKLAKQANSSVLVRYKDTVLLSVLVIGDNEVCLDYLPLMIFYQEKFYAAGKIPGNFSKREGKPSDSGILNARLIDRTLRPLFKKNFNKEIQIVNTILSNDDSCNNEIFAILGSSLAALISNAPFYKAVSAVCVGRVNNQFIINPDPQQKNISDLWLVLSGTKEKLNMIEVSSKEISEKDLISAMLFGHNFIKQLCIFQEEIKNNLNIIKNIDLKNNCEIDLYVKFKFKYFEIVKITLQKEIDNKFIKKNFSDTINNLKNFILEKYIKDKDFAISDDISNNFMFSCENQYKLEKIKEQFTYMFNDLLTDIVREMVLKDKRRIDGRTLNEIRSIKTEVGILPRTHGSAIFSRGETQSLAVVTIGALSECKLIDDLSEEDKESFIVHYNSPPFAVGSIGKYMMPSRREIGHGMLTKKALFHVLPMEQDFPYTIRVVSEILESNGSSSQATICAASMALMDAGVPLLSPVAGLAMGLFFASENDYAILSDIQGLEDQKGDMDFKIAGTFKGITAAQMDIKIEGISFDILREVLEKARLGRIEILNKMNMTIKKHREHMSIYVPKVKMITIPVDKIRDIIGAGGKIINQIIDTYDNVKIDIQQNGNIFIMHNNESIVNQVSNYILNLVDEIKIGKVYEVTVMKILYDKKNGHSFAAIVQIFPGIEGFIHISKLSNIKVECVEDVLSVGQKVLAKCVFINEKGKIDLSLVWEK